MSEQTMMTPGALLDAVLKQATVEGVTLEEVRFGRSDSIHFRFVSDEWAFEYATDPRDMQRSGDPARLAGYICWRAKHRLTESTVAVLAAE
jgi:hypothetical protein